ncbi:MAG: biopolymer transport protein TolR [Azoarcus sp.]|uniref:Cell division and transport-associated protein TolR n=2 Tax=Aromatoleum TaxID=551759 RepID=A0A1N6N8T8_9RHOO|nr:MULTISPECIES: protein TolR [Rhodocyclales]AKU14131.1 biopolymer transport protein ExbD/TolR [Azoarcus sp. CIB]MCK9984687.1 biopolymer transport protein TolR [Azoarcus sp.]NMF98313.1 protein TolR [Aromatoleum toluolicum]SIP88489.1 Cell division and transport-associated protein TolR [Aromatoleum tolulyticum]
MRQRRLMNQINVVPYIDVMLVLLVIFMVTAPMIQTGSVDLPTVGGVPQPPAEAMVVSVKKDGSLTFKVTSNSTEQKMSNTELLRELHNALQRNPQQPILVAADKQVSYERVMDTLDSIRKAGFQKVGLQTSTSSTR